MVMEYCELGRNAANLSEWNCYTGGVSKQTTQSILFLVFKNIPLLFILTASPAAVLAMGWVEASPTAMYQSAARWWMDEQPFKAE